MSELQVQVKQRYKSSTRIDSELADSKVFVDDFILHGTAINILETISRDFEGNDQRAYSITGPYGSGKSTVALFLSMLLSTNKQEREYAEASLDCAEGLKSEFPNRFQLKKGWKTVKHVCAMEPPVHALLSSISTALNAKVSNDEIANFTEQQCLDKIKELLNSNLVKQDGVLILLDEMGKSLDYCANEGKDLYVFQQLADITQSSKNSVILIGFLHQPFSEYAKQKDSKLQQDWAKVQGRYRDLGYNPSVDESLHLLGDAISKTSPQVKKKIETNHKALVSVVNRAFKSKTRNVEDLLKPLPLDPLVSLLLGPISRRRFSQNERSLFGFLASHEKYGFREFLTDNYHQKSKFNSLYSINNLWDYLYHNLYHTIVTSPDSKAWLESCDAIYRAGKRGGELHRSLAKIIALLTLFGFTQHFHATVEFITKYFVCKGYNEEDVKNAITDLEQWTVIIYRAAHDGYFIFEGSDIDINQLIKTQKEKLKSGVDWTKVCDVSGSVLATSHYHKTGTMRWGNKLIVQTINSDLLNDLDIEDAHGKVFVNFVIPTNNVVLIKLNELAQKNENLVVGEPLSVIKLKDIAIELVALERAKKDEAAVVRDKIALKELESRISECRQTLLSELETVFSSSTWKYQGEKLNKQPLSSIASLVANQVFSGAPVIINELVNKAKPSGSANSAIKKLLKAMSEHDDEAALGLPTATFPAEKGLYFSCLANFGLHVKKSDGDYEFVMPKSDTPKLKALFVFTFDYIKEQNGITKISDLVNLWKRKPYGLAKGVIPIWLLAFLQANRKSLAFYDYNEISSKATFINGADEEFAMKILQQPELVGIQFVEINKETTSYLNELALPFKDTIDEITPLAIAQAYVAFYHALSPWTRNTKTLSKELLRFKDETKLASDPNDYLLKRLPSLFGKNKNISDIKADDISTLKYQLENAHDKELLKFKTRIEQYITFSASLVRNCKKVAKFSTNPKVETFALRLSEFGSNPHWVSTIISLLSGKSERNWDDRAFEKANSELIGIIERFKKDLYLSDFGDVDYKNVKQDFNNQIAGIQLNINKLEDKEKKAVLMTLLDDLMEI